MEPLRRLECFIAQVDFAESSSNAAQDHRDIYSYIEQVVLSPDSPIIKHVPPLEVITYSIKNILYPTLALRRIPDLLDLLATAEFYRGRTLDHANDAIIWNDYYRNNQDTAVTLAPLEEGFLRDLELKKDSLRKIYMKILSTCCHLDMYNLWMANPPSITDFFIRFNEYFPFLNEHCGKESPRLFHVNLSDDEIAQLADIGRACCRFAQESVHWVMNNRGDSQFLYDAFQTEEFHATFGNPCEYKDLLQLVEYYLLSIADAAKRVKDMFDAP